MTDGEAGPEDFIEPLTRREREVLALLGEGLSGPEIAERLTLALSSVKTHIQHVYEKLGVSGRRQAVARARALHLLEGPAPALAAGAGAAPAAPADLADTAEPGESPFKGLRYFDEADAALFFGRQALVERLVSRLAGSRPARFLAIVGASGSGKSSVVRAGVIPALRRPGPAAARFEPIHILTPTAHPLEALAASLTPADQPLSATLALMRDLEHDERALHLFARRALAAGDVPPAQAYPASRRLLLVVDQFEELFTLCRSPAERQVFVDNLLYATAPDSDGPTTVIITLRADFYAHCAPYPNLRDLLARHQEFIGPMSAAELRQAIEQPARLGHWSFEPGLVDLILRDVGDEPGGLPLLSHALLETWHNRRGRSLTLTSYAEAGGVQGAIAATAEDVFQSLELDEQALARAIFLRLTELGEGTQDTRRRVALAELLPPVAEARDLAAQVLKTLSDARLITQDQAVVEVAHEALIREWPTLRQWLSEDREGLRLQRRLTEAAQEWAALEREAGQLYRGTRLAQALDWAAEHPRDLNPLEREFLDTSATHAQREEVEREAQQRRELENARQLADTRARAARGFRRLAGGLALLLVVAAVAAGLALDQRNRAQQNFTAAERIRLASQAQVALDSGEGGDLPTLLALHSLRLGYSPEADSALVNALTRGFARQVFSGHSDFLWDAAFAPDGRTIMTASNDGTARLWDIATGQELRQFAPADIRLVVAEYVPPDGRYVVMGTAGTVGYLWDTQTGEVVREFAGNTGGMWWADLSADGAHMLTGDDGGARLWDVQTGQLLRRYLEHPGGASVVAYFSPDPRYLAAFGGEDLLSAWWLDFTTGERLRQFQHGVAINFAAISPDGRFLLTAAGNSAQLWELATGRDVRQFFGHTAATTMVEFSPDGRLVLTASQDRTARLWDVASGRELFTYVGHTGGLIAARFSPDGQFVLTASTDHTTRLWDVAPEVEPHRVSVVSAESTAFTSGLTTFISPDGQFAANYAEDSAHRGTDLAVWDTETGDLRYLRLDPLLNPNIISAWAVSTDNRFLLGGEPAGTVWLWDFNTGQARLQMAGHTAPVRTVALSADGRFILSGSDDGSARLWDTGTGQEVRQLLGHAGPVSAVAFSSDGRQALTGGADHTIRLWDLDTGAEARQFTGHTAGVRSVAFSPDGRWILSGGDDETARLWEAATGREARQFIGHTGQVALAAFAPDGLSVLTGSADQTARLWDTQTGEELRQLKGHQAAVDYAVFTPDGSTIVTSDGNTAYRWRASLADVIAFACQHLTRDLTPDERSLYHITSTGPTCSE